MARGSKFWIYEVEGLYYPCSENKDADQLRGYQEADLRLCFRICKNPVFSRRGSYDTFTGRGGLQRRMVFSGHSFRMYEIEVVVCVFVCVCCLFFCCCFLFFCYTCICPSARCECYISDSLSANRIWKSFLKYK